MNLLIEYLSPTNPIASWIVIILLGFFGIWSIGLITCGIWLLAKRRQIKKNEDVQALANARQKHDPQLEENDQKEKADSIFRRFCIRKPLPEETHVAKHLKAIFLAGWVESRLEVGELINHTTSNLFKWNGILRSVLAIFIVIGLLGTLFGLTDSLTKLSPALQASTPDATSSENSEKMTQALSLLLGQMKGALAPSIWGIGFTILGVIFYSLYLRLVCHPVKSTLERLTLTIWVPQLYPTTSQRGSEAATQFGELVETVQSSISEFNQNLSRTNEITQPLSDSVSQINRAADVLNETFAQKLNDFSQQFTKDVTHLTGFQDEIRNLYQTFQESANQKLDEQNKNIIATLNALKGYEATNIASREQIDDTLQNFLDKATEVNNSINTKNRELLEGIRDQLTTNLNGLNANNRELLESIRDQLTTDLVGLLEVLDDTLQSFLKETTAANKSINANNRELLESIRDQLPIDFDGLRGVLDGTFQNFLKETTAANKSINANNRELLESIRDQLPIDFDGLRGVLDGTFQNFLKETTAANKSINANNRELLEGIRDQLPIDFDGLRGVLDGTFQNFLKETTAANKSINANNRELLEGIRDQLTTNLDELRGILDKQLETLTDQFKDFDVPLEKTADQIEKTANQMAGTVKSFVKFMKRTVGDLQIEYQEQNNQIILLLNQLARKEDIDALTASIQSLTSDSGTLSKSIGEIAQHSQTLAKAAHKLAKQASVGPKIPFWQKIFPFLRK